ncbi:hypothetical protein DFH08DRAFT_1084214 [Mycena albidolilacea]|uniref:Uncharacterized protein n=1 Tax=Mycena albidolilacea TaxID=1033008 RepID=A0AAD6ZNP5_9AGAR|nr:hypothetical protein DFH08DRAFT_1084214 [Mycena albidolilacea]
MGHEPTPPYSLMLRATPSLGSSQYPPAKRGTNISSLWQMPVLVALYPRSRTDDAGGLCPTPGTLPVLDSDPDDAGGLCPTPDPSITIHRTSGARASPTPVDSPYDRLGTVRTAHRCPWTSIRRTPSHKAAMNPGRPAALVFAVMQPHHRPH